MQNSSDREGPVFFGGDRSAKTLMWEFLEGFWKFPKIMLLICGETRFLCVEKHDFDVKKKQDVYLQEN